MKEICRGVARDSYLIRVAQQEEKVLFIESTNMSIIYATELVRACWSCCIRVLEDRHILQMYFAGTEITSLTK